MYVNKWTLGYGERGRAAVQELLDRGSPSRPASRPRQGRVPERTSAQLRHSGAGFRLEFLC